MCFYNVYNVIKLVFRKVVKLLLLALALTSVIFSCNKDTIDAPNGSLNASNYFEELHISYGANSNQKFDLYLPVNRSTSTKVMILIHGGGCWM